MRNRDLSFWLFLAPVILALVLVVLVPLIYGTIYSFTDWDGIKTSQFVGIEHYINLFQDSEFLNALQFTTLFSIASIILINAHYLMKENIDVHLTKLRIHFHSLDSKGSTAHQKTRTKPKNYNRKQNTL